ncbi:Pre-B-cell leukemia transcription factor 3 [Gracilariopsis chorda]|uniref:Pre-B-cell leukemia transcription factor 3 n=1 Tax=Gracilariopsis chorda TaxID=448386 RepID=A0A2V3IPB0_9FLOR|nr:Pre-B-cell leukemia transcription factor 3 [Gracilariopsis chorda]|eukprot:PXF43904.1 Pre-B-cell leukemia transcription factor 3 [Gracilariopsis chorda]
MSFTHRTKKVPFATLQSIPRASYFNALVFLSPSFPGRNGPNYAKLSPRRSGFLGSNGIGHNLIASNKARIRCDIPVVTPDQEPSTKQGNNRAPKYDYASLYDSWRNPKWLGLYKKSLLENHPTTALNVSQQPFFVLPKYKLFHRVSCATSLLAFLGVLCVSYVQLNNYVVRKVAQVSRETINRDIVVGRVARCNPFTGITLKNVQVQPSIDRPTSPVISVAQLDVKFTGFMRSVLRGKPLALDISMSGAYIQLSQVIVMGPKGLPAGQWDPGEYAGLMRNKQHSTGMDAELKQTLATLLRYVQPGKLSIQNAFVRFIPADFLDYGHASEIVDIENANGILTFPLIVESQRQNVPFELSGDFEASVRGTPVEGGTISLDWFMKGDTLFSLQPEDVALTLRVAGEDVRAARVASFLSLPFRADQGRCAADVSMDFLYKSSSLVPIMSGEATLDDVALRFHPDPKTPEFDKIKGKLRFEGKTLFLDGPTGHLGTLPMTIVGDIHMEDGYNLVGYAHQVDVNNVLDTFDVEKFVPVQAQVKGEAHLTGILEEPIITGWAETVGEHAVFDRLPIASGKLKFQWDAIAGLLKFSDIDASIKGGGTALGQGTLYFDMTKPSPYGISRDEHLPRSPKAVYWNPEIDPAKVLPIAPLPEDPLEIDEHAPMRPYDSMMFNFKVSNVDGGNLLKWYGGQYGGMAVKSIGLVSGEGVLAGHAKDANCRVVWKSSGAPPEVLLNPEQRKFGYESTPLASRSQPVEPQNEVAGRVSNEVQSAEAVTPSGDRTKGSNVANAESGLLGGGDFRGLVYLKLGDPPEARRVKLRTIVKGFDGRRAGWADDKLQSILRHSPLLGLSADTYFKGLMFQKPILPPGTTKMPRTPRMELLGADGALAVRNLSLNDTVFPEIMTGSFSFSASDFSLSLKDRIVQRALEAKDANMQSNKTPVVEKKPNELTISASIKGNADMHFRNSSAEARASLSKNGNNDLIATVRGKNLVLHELMGSNNDSIRGDTVRGTMDLSMDLDMTTRNGKGTIRIRDPSLGGLKLSAIGGQVLWRDQNVFLRKGTVKYRRSEYRISARYGLPSAEGSAFDWDVNVNVHKANVKDIAQLILSGNAVASAMQTPLSSDGIGRVIHPNGPEWIRRLSLSTDPEIEDLSEVWEVPTNIPFSEQVVYYHQLLAEELEFPKRRSRKRSHPRPRKAAPRLSDVHGDVTGIISIKYDSRLGEENAGASTGSALLQAVLDQLSRASFSFRLTGTDWMVGDIPIDKVEASGSFEEGVLDIGPLLLQSRQEFGAEVQCRVTRSGSVSAAAIVDNAPAALVNRYMQAPVSIAGNCSGRFQVEGNITNPRALGRVVWTNASLNGKHVRGARTDMACVNGRCLLNVNARIGGSSGNAREESDEERLNSLFWNDSVVAALQDLATRTPSKFETSASSSAQGGKRDRERGEAVSVRVSAPVRFYVRRYLQPRTPGAFWSVLEPVLGGAYPIDDEWILADVRVRKYGLLLLNTVLPELGWDGGDSDIELLLSGTVQKPVVRGRVTVTDGRVWPSVLAEPVHSLRGEVGFSEKGLISVRSLSGRCDGKGLHVSGDMFFSERHREMAESRVERLTRQQQMGAESRASNRRKGRRVTDAALNYEKKRLSNALRGLHVDVGEVGINLENALSSKLSARVDIRGVATRPVVGGTVILSDGEIMLSGGGAGGGGGAGIGAEVGAVSRSAWRRQEEAGGVGNSAGRRLDAVGTGARGKAGAGAANCTSGGVQVERLTVALGRGMRVVQPLVLKLDVSGKVEVDGSTTAPRARGEIHLSRGSIKLLASRMWIRKGEKSFIRFGGTEGGGGGNEGGDVAEWAVVRVALEDEKFIPPAAAPCSTKRFGMSRDDRYDRYDPTPLRALRPPFLPYTIDPAAQEPYPNAHLPLLPPQEIITPSYPRDRPLDFPPPSDHVEQPPAPHALPPDPQPLQAAAHHAVPSDHQHVHPLPPSLPVSEHAPPMSHGIPQPLPLQESAPPHPSLHGDPTLAPHHALPVPAEPPPPPSLAMQTHTLAPHLESAFAAEHSNYNALVASIARHPFFVLLFKRVFAATGTHPFDADATLSDVLSASERKAMAVRHGAETRGVSGAVSHFSAVDVFLSALLTALSDVRCGFPSVANDTLRHALVTVSNSQRLGGSSRGALSVWKDERHIHKGVSSGRTPLSEKAKAALERWFHENLENPYPTIEQKLELARTCSMSLNSVNNWFGNKRMRIKRKMLNVASGPFDGSSISDKVLAPRSKWKAVVVSKMNGRAGREVVASATGRASGSGYGNEEAFGGHGHGAVRGEGWLGLVVGWGV